MKQTERHIIKSTVLRFTEIVVLEKKKKNLYNAANYVMRQSFIYGWGHINYNEMNRLLKIEIIYLSLLSLCG